MKKTNNFLKNSIVECKFKNKKNLLINFNNQIYNYVCNEDELLSSIIEKFKEQTGTKNKNIYFISNGNSINPTKRINELERPGIIYINAYKGTELSGGGFSLKFTDISKKIYEEQYFSESAPSYRIVMEGINIFGICKVKKCKAYKQEVIYPLINKKRFNLIDEKEDLECPECGGNIIPKTAGFYLCNYKITGKKYENKEVEDFEFEGQATKADCIQYYNPDKNGETTMVKLIIEVTEYLI